MSGVLGYGNTQHIGDDESPSLAGPVNLGAGRTAVAPAAGTSHSCAILDNGSVRCWGHNGLGQLGYGHTTTIGDNESPAVAGPVDLGTDRTATAISSDGWHTCVILDNGGVKCWGHSAGGVLGYGNAQDIGDNETPAAVGTVNLGTGRTATAVATSMVHTCAILDNGTLRCWGKNFYGQLGYGNTTDIGDNETPAAAGPVNLGAGRTATAISLGETHTCAILDNGAVKCWGTASTEGRLGYGNTNTVLDPATVGTVDLGAGRTAVAITAAETHTCAILDNGTVRCWGDAEAGQLGYGNTTDIGDNEPPSAAGPVDLGAGRRAVAISSGRYFTCAQLDDGSKRCWGEGNVGQLGNSSNQRIGDNEPASSGAMTNLGATPNVVEVATGSSHTCVLHGTGAMRCWGLNSSGQLGYGNTEDIGDDEVPGAPGTVSLGAHSAVEIAAGEAHTCALLEDATVKCWGDASLGQLGYGNTNDIGDDESPASASSVDLGGESALAITAGDNHTCALMANGTMRCWGSGGDGQLGYGSTADIGDNETPAAAGPLSVGRSVTAITAGGNHTCARLDDGTMRCWGLGTNGRLGYGNTTTIGDNELPSSVGTVNLGRNPTAISAGDSHSCARLDDGTMRCWGLGTNGRLGYGNTTAIGDNESPTLAGAVDAGRSATGVAAGGRHSCARLDNGTVRCWGDAEAGQLGYGNTNDIGDNEVPSATGPVNLGSGRSALEVSAGEGHTCALLDDATVRCWGLNSNGQLGYGDTENVGDDETPAEAGPVDFVDDPPTAVNDSTTIAEDAAATAIGVLANDSDPDGGPRAIVSKTNGAHGVVTITGGGTGLTYLPAANYCGADSFTYELTPGGTKATVSVTVTCVDDAPVASGDLASMAEDAGATAIDVLANDNDSDLGPMKVESTTNGAHGIVTITGEGSGLTYAPEANYCGADSFTYTLNGGSIATVSVTVTCVDDAPTAINDARSVPEDSADTVIDVLANDNDSDLGPMKVESKTNGIHGVVSIIGEGESLTYTPSGDYCGPDLFTYTLNGGSQASVSVTVTCVDDAPVAVGDSANIGEDASATAIDVLANDTDIDAGPKTVNAKTDGTHGTVSITGEGTGLTYQPDPDYCGPDSFTYTLNGGAIATVSVTVTCADDLPVAINDSATVSEDVSATAIDVLANDTDVDGGPKSVASKGNGVHGTVSVTGGGTGVSYTPDTNYCGPDSFIYTLNGGSTASVSVTVSCIDDPPVAVGDSAALIEDASAFPIDVLANDTDIDAGPKTIGAKTNGAHGTVGITGGGTGLTYSPDSNYCGPDSFTYELAPGSSQATVSVTVACDNDPPAAANDTATLAEDAPATSIDVLSNDTDIDGGPKDVDSKTNGSHGTVAITGGGTGITYVPDSNYCGPDSFTYTLNGGSTATVSVTVTCVDDSPTAVGDADTVSEDSSAQTIDVLTNDTDIDGGPKSISGKTNGAHGTVAITEEGANLSYAPDPNYCGPDSFTYTLNGGSQATVTLTIACVDDAPVAVGDSATLAEDASATTIDVLANDTDIDGNKVIASKADGAHGTVAIVNASSALTYTPAANYCGPDSFTYKLNGGSQATVSITVSCVDDAPAAVDDSATIGEDAPATSIEVLSNDTDVDDGASKSIAAKTNGSHGAVVITGGGSGITYQPESNYCGADSFTYQLAPGTSTATVSITVNCVDDPPGAVNDSAATAEDSGAAAIDVLANDTDIDAGPKSITAKTNGAHGAVSVTGGGSGLTFTPDANYCGPDSFTYTLNGGAIATVSVTVTCLDDSPAAQNDADTVGEDSPATAIDVLANDTDIDGGSKSIIGRTNGAHGSVAIIGAGAGLTYTPEANYCGPDSFTYTLNGGSTATVSVTVTCIDEPSPPATPGPQIPTLPPVQGGTAQPSSGPVVNITPGVGVISGRRRPRVAVKGTYAFFTLTCRLTNRDCKGLVRITINVPSIALGPTMRNLAVVKGRFRIGSGRSVLVRAKLTPSGLKVLEKKRSLRGVSARLAIVDTGNGERGRIEVNLVRRPKASLLPGPRASRNR